MWGPNKIIKGTNQNAREETWMIPLNQERLRSWFLALRFLYPKRKLTQYHHLSQNSPSEILWTIIFGTWVRDPLIQYPLSLSLSWIEWLCTYTSVMMRYVFLFYCCCLFLDPRKCNRRPYRGEPKQLRRLNFPASG